MLYDISPLISPRLAVWPGDIPASREILMSLDHGDSVTLSSLRATAHLGAHADAPNHYAKDGASISERDLELYLGPCQVLRVDVPHNGLISVGHLTTTIVAERVLFRTGTFPDPCKFSEDFAAFAPEFIDWLAERGVRLVGIDTPSVDPFSSKTLDAHHAVDRHDMAILEGLRLDDVPEGVYELIALPLRLEGFDASPVRAVLRTIDR